MADQSAIPPQSHPVLNSAGLMTRYWWMALLGIAQQVPNSDLYAQNSVNLTLTMAYVDIPGITLELNRAGIWYVDVTLVTTNDVASVAIAAQLLVRNAQGVFEVQPGTISASVLATSTRRWKVPCNGAQTVKVQAKSAFAGVATVFQPSACISAIWLHP